MIEYTEEDVRDLARSAAARIQQDGWMQGGGPGCCLAIAVTTNDRVFHQPTVIEVRRRLKTLLRLRHHDDGGVMLIVWNDTPGRTADEVIAVLQRVANGEGAL